MGGPTFEAGPTCLLACGDAQGLVVVGDLTKLDDCKRAMEETVAAFGGLDVLVNNGGWDTACCPPLLAKECDLDLAGSRRTGKPYLRMNAATRDPGTSSSLHCARSVCTAATTDTCTSPRQIFLDDVI